MAKVTYHGPGESVEIDGIAIEAGKSADLDTGQVARLRADPAAEVSVEGQEDDTATATKKAARKGARKES